MADDAPSPVSRGGRPIFILGNHRTGTTILYNMLAETGPFCYPTPFHLVHFRDWLRDEAFNQRQALAAMEERFERLGIVDRFIDGIGARPVTPEEYGFVLRGGRITPRSLGTFERFCAFVRSTPGAGPLLLLKNPRDFANFRFMHQAFPQARFIFIHRHPGPTIESRIRELRLLFARRSPYQAEIEPLYRYIWSRRMLKHAVRLGLRPPGAVDLVFLCRFYRNARRFLRDLGALPTDTYTATSYEELCADPEGVIRRLLDFVGAGDADTSVASAMMKPQPRPASGSTVLRSAAAARLLQPYLRHCGYAGLWPREQASG